MYSSPVGFADALNGLYINTGSTRLYGGTLTMTTMDVLAQLYLVNNVNKEYLMSTYNYTEKTSKEKIDVIWTQMYVNILNANKFLESLDTYGAILDSKTLNTYKGEVLGLRAFYYFDLMRMFTPTYTTPDSLNNGLPYYDKTGHEISPYRPNNFVMQKILTDLTAAETLLANNDPAVGQTQVSLPTESRSHTARQFRMNYYAVKALQARVNLWKGNKSEALAAAKFLIDNQSKFPWTSVSDLNGAHSNKVFSTELIFAAENPKLPDVFESVFNPTLSDGELLAPNVSGSFINVTVFENLQNDYRSQFIWKTTGKPYPTFFKYQNGANALYVYNNTVPLIRMGEMYLIAAECEPDKGLGIAYLNALRTRRNISALASTITSLELQTNIMKEYRREFYGEGQLFYYYKRTRATGIISAGTNANLVMAARNYTLPMPLSETAPR